MKLLMVNDEVIVANAMKDEIQWMEYGITNVFLAYSAAEARGIIEKEQIDILLCDIEMPEENGISLLRWVKKNELDMDCIILTCHANFDYAIEAVKLGCQDYVFTPAPYEEIGTAVKKVVTRRMEHKDVEKLQEYGEHWLSAQKEDAKEYQKEKRTPKEIVDECMSYVMEHICDENLSVNDIAAHFFLNPIYLNRIFKKEKEMSISQTIIKEKMVLAAKLLEETELTANAVAIKVGYPSYPHFFTTFKKFYNCSPTQYQEEKRKKS